MKVTREDVSKAEADVVAAWKAYDALKAEYLALNDVHAKAAANARDKVYITEDKLFHLKGVFENESN